jgi:[acyl-carrier-protein] S-malonyltransferase
MARAADAAESGMAALLGADRDEAERIAETRRRDGGKLQVANVNSPGQVVVAGGRGDLTWLADNAGQLGVRRVIPLNVAGAFHSEFMAPARPELARALEQTPIVDAAFPVWSNTTARPHDSSALVELLARQLVEPVLFSDCLLDMAAHGIDAFLHVGPGDVTAGLARKTLAGASVHAVSTVEDIPSVIDAVVTIGGS